MAARKNQGGQGNGEPLRGLRCLVLDNEVLIVMDLEDILRSAGASDVACFGRAADALAAIAAGPPFAVAIIDFDLGGEDGMAVPFALQERGIPFIFFTGLHQNDARLRQFADAPVVNKPYDIDELLAALRRALRKH